MIAEAVVSCTAGVCGHTCNAGYLQCPTGCPTAVRNFETEIGEAGFHTDTRVENYANSGLNVSRVRAFEGTSSLRMGGTYGTEDCTNKNAKVDWHLCGIGLGPTNLAGRTLSVQVYVDQRTIDPPAITDIPSEMVLSDSLGGFTRAPLAVGRWIRMQHRFGAGAVERASFRLFLDVPTQPGTTTCSTVSVDVYLDDFRIE